MAFRALRRTLPAICGAASTAAGIGWYFTTTTPTTPSAFDSPLSHTPTIGSTFEEAAPLVTATTSPLDVCWASNANANASASVNDSVCTFPLDNYTTLIPPTTSNAISTALATFLLLALLEVAVYYLFILGRQIERYISQNVPYSVRSILSTAYQTYYRLTGFVEVAILALNFFGAVNTSKLPMWLHLLIVAGALLHGLCDFETTPLPDALELQAENSGLRMRIESLNKRNVRNASASNELTSALKAKSKTMLAKLEREHQKQMFATEKQHKQALVRSDISHRLRLSGLKMQLSTEREEATSKLNDAQEVIEGHVTRISELEQTMMNEKKAQTTTVTEAQSLIKQSITEKMEMENTIAEATSKINDAQQIIKGHVTRISELEQTMVNEKKAHTTTITEAQQLIKQGITEKMEMENTIAKANGLIEQGITEKAKMETSITEANELIMELLRAHSTGQQQLKTSQRMVRILSKHGQTLVQSLALLTVQFQQRTEVAEKAYVENIFKARLESKMAMEAVIQQVGHEFARSQGIGRSIVQSVSAGADPQEQEQETVVAESVNATADFKFDTASFPSNLWEKATEPISHSYTKLSTPSKQTTTSTRRSLALMSRPMRTSIKSPASSGGPCFNAWNLPALDSFASNGFTPSVSQPTPALSSSMNELPTGDNSGEPSPAATAVDASEINISAPVAVPQLVAIDDPSSPSGFAVVTSDSVKPLTSRGSDLVAPLQDASQSAQSSQNPASSGATAAAGSSNVRSPPVPYRQSKDPWTEHLCKQGDQCVGSWSDYGPDGNYIVNNNNAQRWGSGYKKVEPKLAKKGKDMGLCCDCFKQLHPQVIQKFVADHLRNEANKTEEQKAHDRAMQAHKQERKRERNAAKAVEKAAEEAAEEDAEETGKEAAEEDQ